MLSQTVFSIALPVESTADSTSAAGAVGVPKRTAGKAAARDSDALANARSSDDLASGDASTQDGAVRIGAVQEVVEFIAGPENRLTGLAVQAVLQGTAGEYNPLVLCGPAGAGKSHLARGLAAWWRQQHGGDAVAFLSASEFAQQYADAVGRSQVEPWRAGLREAELFVLEDLGQIEGKRAAQSELLHTLDALWRRESLVVVTARSLPSQLAWLMPGLRSRLAGGLSVPVALPGPDARREILERLAAQRGLSLSKRTMQTLADQLAVPVSGLMSALYEFELDSDLSRRDLSASALRRLMAGRVGESLTLRGITAATAKYFGLKMADLKSPLRRQTIVAARGVAIYLARMLTDMSLEQIGVYFGGRDHTTVLHSFRRVEKLIKRDPATRQAVTELKRQLCLT